MNLDSLWKDDRLFWEALAVSLMAHLFVSFKAGEFSLRYQQKHTVEIDITNMGHVGTSALPKRPAAPVTPSKPAAPRKEWVKPAPNQKAQPAPIPTQPVAPAPEEAPPIPTNAASSNSNGEYNVGTGDGSANVLSRIPQLMNLSDLRAIMRRFYPEEAREQGRQASVVLDLHIDTDGLVTQVDIVRSGGSDFDQAAIKVAKLLRFTPAFLGSRRVNVKMRQAIQFKLEH